MTLSLIAGVLVALVAVTFVSAVRRAPTRIHCPDCGGDTQPVRLPAWMTRAAPEMLLRWCAACGWEGLGREGAEWVPGRRIAHRSGFFWGEERMPPDFGFRFADARHPVPCGVRPSGFAGAEDRGLPAPGSFHWKDAG
jgi:hypothetical protein